MSQLETQMRHCDREMVPRVLVRAMFGLMLASVVLVTFAVLTDRPHVGAVPDSPVVQDIKIVLTGDRSGAYTATTPDGTLLAVSSDDRMGFVGVIGRVVERKRKLSGVDPATPVTLARRQNGHLAIFDQATGTSLELVGYGSDNMAALARLLH